MTGKSSGARVSRRTFVGQVAAAAGVTIVPRHVLGGTGFQAPSDTVHVAVIGYVHGHGMANLNACARTDTIVALCDLDESAAARAAAERTRVHETYASAARYTDYRVMLEKQKDIDAVVVATPDHTHATIAMAAMQLGKHVFVQKPLTRTISEARILTEAARRYKVVTQMGNQGHSEEGLRLIEEWITAGAIGTVREVHSWSNRPIWPQGMPRPTDTPPVPEGFNWDLWLGPIAYRPYHPTYHPFGWRAWQDFGCGAIGDMGCHVLDAPFHALRLGSPSSVTATVSYTVERVVNPDGTSTNRRLDYTDSFPPSSVIHYTFAAAGGRPEVKVHWYDGGILPERPADLEPERRMPSSGTLFVGDKGKLWCEATSDSPRLIPETAMAAFDPRPPKTLPRVEGGRGAHEKNWLDAIRTGGQAVSHFDYAGPFTESVLLGNVAMRFPGQRLQWDPVTMTVPNVAAAQDFIQHHYRAGWTL